MKKTTVRALSFVLALVITYTSLDVSVMAASVEDAEVLLQAEEKDWTLSEEGVLTFDASVKEIEEEAFKDNLDIKSVVFPASLWKIHARAFQGCKNITRIVIPQKVQWIGDNAFKDSGIKDVVVEGPLFHWTIFHGIFEGCTLENVSLPEGMEILPGLFDGASFKEGTIIDIPASVKEFFCYTFRNVQGLKALNFKGEKLETIDCLAFDGSDSVEFYVNSNYTDTYKTLINYGIDPERIVVSTSVYYNLKHGVGDDSYPTKYTNRDKEIVLKNPTKDGYLFAGWYLNNGKTDIKYVKIGTTDDIETHINTDEIDIYGNTLHLTAEWDGPIYDVTLDPRGGELPTTSIKVFGNKTYGQYFGSENNELPVPVREGMTFRGWYTEAGVQITSDTAVTGAAEGQKLFAKYKNVVNEENVPSEEPEEEEVPELYSDELKNTFWITYDGELYDESKVQAVYNGTALKLSGYKVYYDKNLLEEGKDYTVSYANNTKVNASKPAQIKFTFKGNYSGTMNKNFQVVPNNLVVLKNSTGKNHLTGFEKVIKAYNGKVQKYKPVLKATMEGKTVTLVEKKDYTLTYQHASSSIDAILYPNEFKGPGKYKITVKGINNFEGTFEIIEEITENKMISTATVSGVKNMTYAAGEPIYQPGLVVKIGKTTLVKDRDYTLEYSDNKAVGTASIKIVGNKDNGFSGSKTVTFKIIGTPLSKVKVSGIQAMNYTGAQVELPELSLIYQASKKDEPKTLSGCLKHTYGLMTGDQKEKFDYVYTYTNNINKGTAKLTLEGVNGFTGTVAKTFTIKAFDVKNTANANMIKVDMPSNVQFVKGGAKPKPVVTHTVGHENVVLTEGKDYTLSYANNGKVNDGSNPKKMPTVNIAFKGNYIGKTKAEFVIVPSSITNATVSAPDKVAPKPVKFAKQALTVRDADGKALVANKDYTAKFYYDDNPNEEILPGKIMIPGDDVRVVITGCGDYAGNGETISCVYRYVSGSVSAASITIPKYTYTGRAIRPSYDDITVKVGKKVLSSKDFTISYSNNVKVGNAKLTITGKGDYTGTKTVTFKIVAKSSKDAVYVPVDAKH